jgi:hypothetical protein
MNTLVALPIAAAVPTTAPVDATELDRPGALKRMEQVVELLRTCYVREGWTIDNEAAERALAFMRQYAKDGSEPDDGREATLDFLHSHGQSLDSVFCGDVGVMVCWGAQHSERANSLATAADVDPIFAAIEKHKAVTVPYDAAWKARGCFNDFKMMDEDKRQLRKLNDAIDEAGLPMEQAACELIDTAPTTLAGVVAAIRIIQACYRDDGEHVPRGQWL